jgi:hypothetical protein
MVGTSPVGIQLLKPEAAANNIKPTGGLPLPAQVEQTKTTPVDVKALSAKV